jgi:hypothetical protein
MVVKVRAKLSSMALSPRLLKNDFERWRMSYFVRSMVAVPLAAQRRG